MSGNIIDNKSVHFCFTVLFNYQPLQLIWSYSSNHMYTVNKALGDFVVCDWWCCCKAPCDVQFSKIEGNGWKFSHIKRAKQYCLASSVIFSNSVAFRQLLRSDSCINIFNYFVASIYLMWQLSLILSKSEVKTGPLEHLNPRKSTPSLRSILHLPKWTQNNPHSSILWCCLFNNMFTLNSTQLITH